MLSLSINDCYFVHSYCKARSADLLLTRYTHLHYYHYYYHYYHYYYYYSLFVQAVQIRHPDRTNGSHVRTRLEGTIKNVSTRFLFAQNRGLLHVKSFQHYHHHPTTSPKDVKTTTTNKQTKNTYAVHLLLNKSIGRSNVFLVS